MHLAGCALGTILGSLPSESESNSRLRMTAGVDATVAVFEVDAVVVVVTG